MDAAYGEKDTYHFTVDTYERDESIDASVSRATAPVAVLAPPVSGPDP